MLCEICLAKHILKNMPCEIILPAVGEIVQLQIQFFTKTSTFQSLVSQHEAVIISTVFQERFNTISALFPSYFNCISKVFPNLFHPHSPIPATTSSPNPKERVIPFPPIPLTIVTTSLI